MTERIFHLTPPMRHAVIELALAYADWREAPMPRGITPTPWTANVARRLLDAQTTLGVELIKNERLQSYFIKAEAA